MDKKKQVLIVTNAITDDEVLQIKGAFLTTSRSNKDIKLILVHVIPRLPMCYFNMPSMGLLIEQYYAEAKYSISHVGKHLNIAKKDQWLITGKIRTEVLRLANKVGSSLILASEKQSDDLRRSLFIKNIQQYALATQTGSL
jgi:hypothetical protein